MGFTGNLRTQEGRKEFMQEVARIEQFLNDPWLIKSSENATVHVLVPKVVIPSPPAPPLINGAVLKAIGSGGEGPAFKPAALAQTKRVVLQKQLVAAQDLVKKLDHRDLVTSLRDADGGEQGQSNSKLMCRMCFTGENEGGEKVRKMLSCNACGKKYHLNCLKRWSQNRDLFHWSSWTCPSCRICEVCLKTGDPSKFMFCKRCDGAYHCYCQQPPHKNVGHGPYLCPKHTRCHSCGSSVPGNGLSVRWFLGYTCCDACGRLFVKGNFCPICLKVYRDSESTPMVCCDVCQRWVHCPCDGISDSKYMEFQVDGNLQYVCPTCRGECSQIGTFEEAVQELWRRRDEADKELISSLKADAGLPTQEEIFDISPFSDDEDSSPVSKAEYGRSLKFSLKGFNEKSPKKSKEHGKKSLNKVHVKKKGSESSLMGGVNAYQSFGVQADMASGADFVHRKIEVQSPGEHAALSPVIGSLNDGNHKLAGEVAPITASNPSRTIKIKNKKLSMEEEVGASSGGPTASGRKLVIHLGGRSRNTTSPTKSEAVSVRSGQDLTSSGTEDSSKVNHLEHIDGTVTASDKKAYKKVLADQVKGSKSRGKEGQVIKLRKVNPAASDMILNPTRELSEHDPVSQKNLNSVSTKGGSVAVVNFRNNSSKCAEGSVDTVKGTGAKTNEGKPFLKFKIPKSCNDGNQADTVSSGTQDRLPLHGKDELIYTRGQRSKRKRPALAEDDNAPRLGEENTMKMNDLTDANWILLKLGKDAVGKRVEVHQPSSDTWRRGTVVEVVENSSTVSIAFEDGKTKSFQVGKQGIRFISQKRKQ